jgi:hypothetical protein
MRFLRPLVIRNARLPVALLLPVLLASAPLAAQQVYKWTDASGVTHFTAEPPPAGAKYEAREVDHHEAVPQAATDASDAGDARPAARTGEDPGCATARGNLALLDGKAQVTVDSDGDGKADKTLSEADRAKQRQLAQAVIAVKCIGKAAAQAPEPEEE